MVREGLKYGGFWECSGLPFRVGRRSSGLRFRVGRRSSGFRFGSMVLINFSDDGNKEVDLAKRDIKIIDIRHPYAHSCQWTRTFRRA
ncbi:hypothetical protein P8452_46028 [Trifolium repens]|nr:hypothetical protein P8452_46028 [Trifolium repens]